MGLIVIRGWKFDCCWVQDVELRNNGWTCNRGVFAFRIEELYRDLGNFTRSLSRLRACSKDLFIGNFDLIDLFSFVCANSTASNLSLN